MTTPTLLILFASCASVSFCAGILAGAWLMYRNAHKDDPIPYVTVAGERGTIDPDNGFFKYNDPQFDWDKAFDPPVKPYSEFDGPGRHATGPLYSPRPGI